MAKSTKKDLQARKRAKRRDAFRAALLHPWDGIDVSAWLDTSFILDEETGKPYDSCLSERGWYELKSPAETYLSWWAARHQDEESEVHAVRLAASLERARRKAEQSSDKEEKARYKELCSQVVQEMKELACREGAVTANLVLGVWHLAGTNVRKNRAKAKDFLLKAAERDEPLSLFLLAHYGLCPDRAEEFFQRTRALGCRTAFIAQGNECRSGKKLTEGELEVMAAHLAAFAYKNDYISLASLVRLMQEPEGEILREAYAQPMLALLRRAAAAGVDDAVFLLGFVLDSGRLCRRDPKGAKELFFQSMQRGEAAAGSLYAKLLFAEAMHLPEPEKKAKMQEACAIVRKNSSKDRRPAESFLLLGHYLTRSDDEAEFKEGMACLKKCLAYNDDEFVLDNISRIVLRQPSAKRRAMALKLLEGMAKAGTAGALYLKGLYSLMGMFGEEAKKQGAGLLLEAGQKGAKDAWGALAAVYALGLCGCRANSRKALEMAAAGDEAGSENAHVWRILLELGAFFKKAEPADGLGRDPRTTARDLGALLDRNSGMLMNLAGRLIWLDAVDLRSTAEPFYHFPDKPSPVQDFDDLIDDGIQFAMICESALKCGTVPLAAFAAHALKKISLTEYERFYTGALAVRLGLAHDASAAKVIRFLKEYIQGLPESFFQFRDKEEDPGLEERTAAWKRHLRTVLDKA